MTPTSNWDQIFFYFRPSLMAMEMFILYSTWADLPKNGFSRAKSGSLFSRILTLLLSEVFLFCWVFLLKKTSTSTHWEFLENLEKLSVRSHLWFTRKPSKHSPLTSSTIRSRQQWRTLVVSPWQLTAIVNSQETLTASLLSSLLTCKYCRKLKALLASSSIPSMLMLQRLNSSQLQDWSAWCKTILNYFPTVIK